VMGPPPPWRRPQGWGAATGRGRRAGLGALACVSALLTIRATAEAADPTATCLRVSGNAGRRCLGAYVDKVGRCRRVGDTACEEALHAADGELDLVLAQAEAPTLLRCTEAGADALGYTGRDDVPLRIREACVDFAEDLLAIGVAADAGRLEGRPRRCQRRVTHALTRVREAVVRELGPGCIVPAFSGDTCRRTRRDRRVARVRGAAEREILRGCGTDFDALGLAEGPTRAARVAALVDLVIARTRHFTQRVYPPNDLGPTADFDAVLNGSAEARARLAPENVAAIEQLVYRAK